MTSILTTGLHKRFSSSRVLGGVELQISEGSVYGLLGSNGAGKTTLLKLLMGLYRPDAGEARVLGADLMQGSPEQKSAVGYVSQQDILPGWMRIRELLHFERALRPSWEPEGLEAWLAAEKLRPRRRVGHLSTGQRKRLEIELALAAKPRVLLLDEPLASLDPVSRAEVIEKLMAHAASDDVGPVTILISSHILSDLERLCDHVGVLSRGTLAFAASLDALKESTAVVSMEATRATEALPIAATTIGSCETNGRRIWVVEQLDDQQAETLTTAGFSVSRGSLDEVGVALLQTLA